MARSAQHNLVHEVPVLHLSILWAWCCAVFLGFLPSGFCTCDFPPLSSVGLTIPPCLDITALAMSSPNCPPIPEPYVGPGRWCSLDVT